MDLGEGFDVGEVVFDGFVVEPVFDAGEEFFVGEVVGPECGVVDVCGGEGGVEVEHSDEAGPLASPNPTAIATSGATNAAYSHDAPTNRNTPQPIAARAKPAPIAARLPILTASGVISGVIAIIPAAAGNVASPACNALIPRAAGFWKYRLITYMSALIAPATIRIATP